MKKLHITTINPKLIYIFSQLHTRRDMGPWNLNSVQIPPHRKNQDQGHRSHSILYGCFHKWGYPKLAGWFVSWKTPKMDDNWGYTHDLGNPHILHLIHGIFAYISSMHGNLEQNIHPKLRQIWVHIEHPWPTSKNKLFTKMAMFSAGNLYLKYSKSFNT